MIQYFYVFCFISWASLVAQMVKHLPEMQDTGIQSLGREDPLKEENGNSLQYSCLENLRDRSLVGCRLWGLTESDTTEVT